jgi:hypothetical protein
MKLMTADIPGERGHRVDVCGLDAGHEGGHEGKYAGITTRVMSDGTETVDKQGVALSYGTEPDPGAGRRRGLPDVG